MTQGAPRARAFLERDGVKSVLLVSRRFRSYRDHPVYSAVLEPTGIAVRCTPVFSGTTTDSWTVRLHGIQNTVLQLLRPRAVSRQARRFVRERVGRVGHRPVQDGDDLAPRTVAHARGYRVCDARVGRLVQYLLPTGPDWPRAARGVRSGVASARGNGGSHRVRSLEKPGRFTLHARRESDVLCMRLTEGRESRPLLARIIHE